MAASSGITQADFRASIQREKLGRVKAHQANIANAKRMSATLAAGQPQRLNLIAQGDSWFDYKLPILHPSDVIAHLKNLPNQPPEILNALCQAGEATEDMLGVIKLHELIAELQDPANGTFDAILFSGGGNDLAGNQFRLWVNEASTVASDPTKGLNGNRVDCILGVVEAGYQDLMDARTKYVPGTPIFAHSYDFAIPTGIGVCNLGPWLKPGLDDRGWTDPLKAREIVRQLLLEFAKLLDGFASVPANNFVHVHTQGTLADQQWSNELHPTPDGFAAITTRFVDALRLHFPGRI